MITVVITVVLYFLVPKFFITFHLVFNNTWVVNDTLKNLHLSFISLPRFGVYYQTYLTEENRFRSIIYPGGGDKAKAAGT